MNDVLVSVIIPVYNAGLLLGRMLDSVLAQSEKRFEVILVDDGSTDGDTTAKIIEEYIHKDERIRVIRQMNQGAELARKNGVLAANGKYVYICDQDDYLHPQLLEYCLFVTKKYDVEFVAFRYANCAGDKIPNIKPLGDFDLVHVTTPESNYLAAHSFHTDFWVQFVTKKMILRYDFSEESSLPRPFALVKMAKRWVVADVVLYYYNNGVCGSMMHKPMSADKLRKMQREMILFWELYADERKAGDPRGLWEFQCRKFLLSLLKQALNSLRRDKLCRATDVADERWRILAETVREIFVKRKIPWRYVKLKHLIYYWLLLLKYPAKNRRRTLAVVGGGYLQLPLVEKAKEMGFRTVCFSWEEGAVCKNVCDRFYPISIVDKESVLDVCRKEKIDGITSIASDVAVPTISYVASRLGLPGNSEDTAFRCTNKNAMRASLKSGGLRVPESIEVCATEKWDAITVKLAGLHFPLIVKPSDRSGSLGVTKCESETELSTAIATALECSLSGSAVVEEFVTDAREISVEGISFGGKYYPLAITDKVTTGSPHFVELAHHQPADLDEAMKHRVIDFSRKAVDALGVTSGATHAEMMIDHEGQLFITEVGARMGGDFIGSDLVRLSTGYDFVQGVIQCSLGEFCPPILGDFGCAGVLFSSVDTPDVRKYLESGEAATSPWCVRAENTSDEVKPELLCSADRDGYLIYMADHRISDLSTRPGVVK